MQLAFRYLKNHYKVWQESLNKLIRRNFKAQHQLTSTTMVDRYPEIFKASVQECQHKAPKILSFGCSTGEECVSLRSYFPEAEIIGADINKQNLKKAKKRNLAPGIKYMLSTNENLESNGPYDLVFAMSVLCRWKDTEHVQSCENIYPFEKFNESVEHLYSLLSTDGILVVYNANFLIEDTTIAEFLKPIKVNSIKDSGFVHKFNKQNQKINPDHQVVLFRKKEINLLDGSLSQDN